VVAFVLRRILQAVFVVFGVTCVVFFMIRLVPGDPASLMVPPGSSQAQIDIVRRQLGTDQPLFVQFLEFLSGLVRGDLGESFRQGQPVLGLVLDALPYTLALGATSMLLAIVVAVPLGIAAAYWSGGLLDRIILIVSLAAQSAPNFWLGVLLALFVAINLGLVPATGATSWSSIVLPSVALAVGLVAVLVRTVRQAMMEVLSMEYIRAARAKGLSERKVVLSHAFRNAAIPLVTVLGLQVGYVLGGAAAIELVFNWPGAGLLALQAMNTRDFPVVQGTVIVIAVAFTATNLAVDIIYAYLNPRIRLGGGEE
jgi:peptide/nickel transport system permease protein